MSLLSSLRVKQATRVATATPATLATDASAREGAVASVAPVAVAKYLHEQTAGAVKIDAADFETKSRWWLIHFSDRDPVRVVTAPPATYAEMRKQYSGAVALEPFIPSIRQPSAHLNANEEITIRKWLTLIDETDLAIVDEVIDRCHHDVDARGYFISRAEAELPKPVLFLDDRRTCDQCLNLTGRRCRAAMRGEIAASRDYEPIRGLLQRCEGYTPRANDSDKRSGAGRLSDQIYKGGE